MRTITYRFSAWILTLALALTGSPLPAFAQTQGSTVAPPPSGSTAPAPGGTLTTPPPGGTVIQPLPSPGGTLGAPSGGLEGEQNVQPRQLVPPPGGAGQFSSPMPGPTSGQRRPGSRMMPGGEGGMMGGEKGAGMMPGGQLGPNGEGQMMGPSEADFEKMQQQQEEQGKKMRLRGLEQMKRGVKQFSRILEKFKARMDKLESQGVPVPADCKANVETALAMVKGVLEATDPDFMDSFDPSDLQTAGEALQECGPKIEQMAQLPKIIKQITAQVTRLEKRAQSLSARAARAGFDVSEIMGKVNDGITDLKNILEQLKAGGAEDPFSALQELPEKFEDIQQQLGSVEALFQLQRELKRFKGIINRFENQVKRLEKKGEGSETRTMLDELKGIYNEVKGLKPTADTLEDLFGQVQRAYELVENIEEELNIRKGPAPLFQLEKGGRGSMPEFNLPQLEKLLLEHEVRVRYATRNGSRLQARLSRARYLAAVAADASQVAGVKIIAPW